MKVFAIDPGYEVSAYVLFDGQRIVRHGIESNAVMLAAIGDTYAAERNPFDVSTVLEQIESYGMAVGREVFETVFWTGRFYQRAQQFAPPFRMPRKVVKLHLCQSVRAQDSNIRVAIMDRFGGKERAIGRKAAPGPLFGIKSHEWAALAIAVTYWDQKLAWQRKAI